MKVLLEKVSLLLKIWCLGRDCFSTRCYNVWQWHLECGSHLCNDLGNLLLGMKLHLEDGEGERWKKSGFLRMNWPTLELAYFWTSYETHCTWFKPVKSGYFLTCNQWCPDIYAGERKEEIHSFMPLASETPIYAHLWLNPCIALFLIRGTLFWFPQRGYLYTEYLIGSGRNVLELQGNLSPLLKAQRESVISPGENLLS